MRLLEAFEIINQPRSAESFDLWFACGFTPMHAGTFLHAHVQELLPARQVKMHTGLYGDLIGNLRRAAEASPDAIAIAVEWQDLDPRLGIRQLGGWTPEATDDIVRCVNDTLARLEGVLGDAPANGLVAICPPTLPLPPFSHEPGFQAGTGELAIRSTLAACLGRLTRAGSIRVVSMQALDANSPAAARFDVKSEISTGFPYTAAHADAVASLMGCLIADTSPRKGLITDLDDTLWRGILGEVGPQGVTWDMAHKTHVHGLYQQMVAALSARGVLTAVVSKNDPALVRELFQTRNDLLVPASAIYPIEAGWGRKSEAVGRVLQAWNIAADSVVFVDDSPLELEEVRAAHPGIETLRFLPDSPADVWNLITRLRDLFGKPHLREEDRLRLRSLRAAGELRAAASAGPSEDEFLGQLQAVIGFDRSRSSTDDRPLELINKTNQFNLNGRRITEGQWRERLADCGAFLMVVSYRDKFGPLGRIAVIQGRMVGGSPKVDAWVMSCRAFSRRIEYACLRALFEETGGAEIEFDYCKTDRNGPTTDFLASLTELPECGAVRISRAAFERCCPRLFHTVEDHAGN